MYSYLTVTAGEQLGRNYVLQPKTEARVGRGLDCEIILTDGLASRVHALVFHRQGQWYVRDNQSLNGLFVNDTKADEALLVEGCYFRVGTTELTFHQASERPSLWTDGYNTEVTQTIVRDARVDSFQRGHVHLGALQDTPQVRRLLLMHQLAIRHLSTTDPEEVIRVTLDLLQDLTRASVAGFLWVDSDGRLRPKMVLPEERSDRFTLSESLSRKVIEDRRAVWVSNHESGEFTESLRHFADAICVPVDSAGTLLGAIHLYLQQGRFTQDDFEVAAGTAGIAAVALVRAYREERLTNEFQRLQAQSGAFDELIGENPNMRTLKDRIGRFGPTDRSVLILGESGTGKELVARALHRFSKRAERPMLAVNCAAIPKDLVESQLFGHKAGAFTGADRDHAGFFQQADGGTLFLDEMGEMELAAQAKLLRILEGHPFMPVGGTEQITVDVRVIAATNQNLEKHVEEKTFRGDLYYRLNNFRLDVPPLRERGGDVEKLVDHFLDHFRHQHGRPRLRLSAVARKRLLSYQWPGNVRQLRNVLDSAVVLAGGDSIEVDDLGLRDAGESELDTLNLEHWERKLIKEALKRTNHNVTEAANLLGIARATLYRKLKDYKIEQT